MVWSILARVHGTAPEVAPYPDEQSSVGSSQHSSITPPIQPVCIAIISLQGGTAWATADAGTDTRAAATTSHFIFRPQGGASGSRAPARLGRSAIARAVITGLAHAFRSRLLPSSFASAASAAAPPSFLTDAPPVRAALRRAGLAPRADLGLFLAEGTRCGVEGCRRVEAQ